MTGGPGKEHGTNEPRPTRIIKERSKGERKCQSVCSTNLPESFSLESVLAEWCGATRKDLESEWMARDHLKTNPITIKPEPQGRAVCLASLTPLLSAWMSCLNKVSCFASMCVSLDNSFPSVRQGSTLEPWKRSPFLQHTTIIPILQVSEY